MCPLESWDGLESHQDQLKALMPPLMPTPLAPQRSDTPTSLHPAHALSVSNSTLEETCKAIKDNVLYKTKVSLDDFVKTFLPCLPEHLNITHIPQHLLNLEALNKFSSSPSTNEDEKNAVFKQLTSLFNKIVNAVQCVWKERCLEKQWSLPTPWSQSARAQLRQAVTCGRMCCSAQAGIQSTAKRNKHFMAHRQE
jgi:hypothetical protein